MNSCNIYSMVKKIVFMGLSIMSLLAGVFFLADNQLTVTGGFLGTTGASAGSLLGFVFIILSGLFYFLTGKAKKDEGEGL
jgi:hypothetical protein